MPQFSRRKLMNPRSLVIETTEETERPSVVYLKEASYVFLNIIRCSDCVLKFLVSPHW
jgi:hypothetical protein